MWEALRNSSSSESEKASAVACAGGQPVSVAASFGADGLEGSVYGVFRSGNSCYLAMAQVTSSPLVLMVAIVKESLMGFPDALSRSAIL